MGFNSLKSAALVLAMVQMSLVPALAAESLKGSVTYTLHKSANPTDDELDAYSRITAAVDSAVKIYNTYTMLSKHINVYYAPGVPTAEASYNGDLRFGNGRSYMNVRTALHEMGHTMGMGTTADYRGMFKDGVFQGEKTQALVKELSGDPAAEIHGDAQHFWPYGLNYDNEVKSEMDLIIHARIVESMYQEIFKEAFVKDARLKYMADGQCMGITANNGLEMMDCSAEGTKVKVWSVGDNPVTYRFQFGTRVIDVPNESTAAGVVLGTYGWNGGAHQRYILEETPVSTTPNAFYLQNYKSKLYLIPSGKDIVQEQRDRNIQTGIWILEDSIVMTPDTSVVTGTSDSTEAQMVARKSQQTKSLRQGLRKFDASGREISTVRNRQKFMRHFTK